MGPSYLSAPILVVLAYSRQRIRVGLRLGVSKGEITPNLRYALVTTIGHRMPGETGFVLLRMAAESTAEISRTGVYCRRQV